MKFIIILLTGQTIMAQESQKTDSTSPVENGQDKLVNIKTGNKEKQVLEINKQMSSLETSINKLSRQLTSTNKQVKTDVDRLSASDAEITDKVADTYKQLGVIENTFQGLSTQSSQIKLDLKKVNTTIRALEKDTKASLDSAIQNQSAINGEFKLAHEDLIARSQKLSKKATSIAKKLDKSIKDNSKALSQLESTIVDELQNVAQSSEERDNKLEDKISSQKAKMLLMQGVDEALEKRATSLEDTSQKLIKDSENLKDITRTLDVLTSKLSTDVEELELHTAQLAEQNEQQQGMIEQLQDKSESLGRTLLALVTLEKKHFRTLASASLLLLLVVLGVFFYGEYSRNTEGAVEAQRNDVVNDQISDLQNRVENEQMASQVFYKEITNLENNIGQVKDEMQQVTDQLKEKVQHMTDQVDSIDGRIQYMNPLYNFGTDNTIHGSQWISELDANLMSIKIATVSNKQELYEIAQRYNNYFTEDMAYFITEDKQYTLIYGGKFATEQQINNIIRRMPRYMNNQLISPVSNADVLKQITR